MESIGGKLKSTREEKGYSLEQVARETHIAKRFLEAMEVEDFSVFPGEPYLVGFLRTYSGYLGLDPAEMVSLYHNLKLQEQPAPIDELLDRRSAKPISAAFVAIAVAVVIVVAAVVLYLTGVISFGRPARQAVTNPVTSEAPVAGETITLVDEILERRFVIGDAVVIPVGDDEYPLLLSGVDGGLILKTAAGEVALREGEEELIDVDLDDRQDIKVLLRSVDESANPVEVVLRFDRVVQSPSGRTTSPARDVSTGEARTAAIGSTNEASRVRRASVILESEDIDERFVEMEFRGYSLLRYQIDEGESVERYFQSGDTFRSGFTDHVFVGVSNAGAVRTRVGGRDVDLGGPGEVAVWQIAWAENGEIGPVRLELVPVY